jgi:protein involved in polysaccharide export with SLBB domain
MDDRKAQTFQELTNPPGSIRTSVLCVPVLLSLGLFSFGCSHTNEDIVAFLKAHEHVVSGNRYTLAPPDMIAIHAPVSPEVNGTVHQINPQGKIGLKLLGEVKVAGLTPEEAAAKIELLLDRYYIAPEVSIEVTGYNSKSVYVFGHVGRRGPFVYTGRDTLMDLLAKARPTNLAWRAKIEVVRPDPVSKERKKLVIDLDEMIRKGDPTMNVLLEEGDIIYVPPTPLAWLGLRVRELLYPVDPVLEAYERPATAMATYDYYKDRNDDDSDSSGTLPILRRW